MRCIDVGRKVEAASEKGLLYLLQIQWAITAFDKH